jgi:hypothetical protein
MSSELLDQIAKLAADQDAAGLQGLRDHTDKVVRKAARKAIHTLRSKGIEIPSEGRAWTASDVVKELRGEVVEGAALDMFSAPGLTRFVWAIPGEERGGMLVLATLASNDGFTDFQVYGQSDSQRSKMMRDWSSTYGEHRVPADWARARLRWAREQTVGLGYAPPPGVDDMLERLGANPDERPVSFLPEKLADAAAGELALTELLSQVGALRWPLLFKAEDVFKELERRGEARAEDTALEAEDRIKELLDVSKGDENWRKGLRGPLANLLDDLAIALWQNGRDGDAKILVDLAAELRSHGEPETLEQSAELLSAQITGVVLRQQMQQQQQQQRSPA